MKTSILFLSLAFVSVIISGCSGTSNSGTNSSVYNGQVRNSNQVNTASPSPNQERDSAQSEDEMKQYAELAKNKHPIKPNTAKREANAEDSTKADGCVTLPSGVIECTVSWGEPWYDGDCTLARPEEAGGGVQGPKYVYRSDGTGEFLARGRSTDDDDTYVVRIENKDNAGNVLWYSPERISPIFYKFWVLKIPHPGVWYGFNNTFTFPKEKFNLLASIEPLSGC